MDARHGQFPAWWTLAGAVDDVRERPLGRTIISYDHAGDAGYPTGPALDQQEKAEARRARLARSRRLAAVLEALWFELRKVIVGQDRTLERVLVCLLARGHVLLEGVPGLAKTLLTETLATTLGGTFTRVQFTPDLVPSDIVGTRIYRASREQFDIEYGPVFANFVLADEINRAPAKVQSALLEVMAERHVTIAGTTRRVPDPFIVLATQNPLESEGVYPLPEAQQDRFLMKVLMGHPTYEEELEIVRRMSHGRPTVDTVIDLAGVRALQQAVHHVYVDPEVIAYAVRLVVTTRDPAGYDLPDLAPAIAHGASPRASLGLVNAAAALAVIRGRGYVLPSDVTECAHEVLRHRVMLTYEAIADGATTERVIDLLLEGVPRPDPPRG